MFGGSIQLVGSLITSALSWNVSFYGGFSRPVQPALAVGGLVFTGAHKPPKVGPTMYIVELHSP